MKIASCFSVLVTLLVFATPSPAAADTGTATCGPNDDYVTLYYSLDTFEMGGRLACGSKLTVLDDQQTYAAQHTPYVRVQTADGKLGYVTRNAIVIAYTAPPPPPPSPAPAASEKPASRGKARAPISAPVAAAPVPPPAAVPTLSASVPVNPPTEIRVPDGTEIEVKLTAELSSERAAEGTLVDFTVNQPLTINGVTVFERGAPAHARVIQLRKAARFGHDGEVYWTMQDVTAVDGKPIPARFVAEAQDTAASGLSVGVLAASGDTRLVEQSSFSLHKGDAALIPSGQIFKVLIHGDAIVHLAVPAPARP